MGEFSSDLHLRMGHIYDRYQIWRNVCIRPTRRNAGRMMKRRSISEEAGGWNSYAINLHLVASFTPMKFVLEYPEGYCGCVVEPMIVEG